ncbi:ABC transporter substrate-binding protein [Parafrankia sp. EUN1f]|uniref:ABC transporter substrate-binding protein n=1 Tax=Parafrankia sp. EUN1f TaxID=102897 RepID=UPI0001C455E4|nr:ABC transporter substrate-binding protein [Parafrankia sp. EUN1f]EFC84006.1 ABC-type branched-chain amino acid transport systems periplasmic component-like protein [Parafrankia sp. EUN1f]
MRTGGLRCLLCAAVAVLLAGVSGCAAQSGAPEATAAACDSPGVTADQVRIGLVVSDTGTGSLAFSSARAGVDARLGLANAEGGVHGRKVVYDWQDDKASQSDNAQVVRDLVDGDSVFGILSVSIALGGSLDDTEKQGVPVVGLAVESWARYQNLFAYAYQTSPQTVGRYIQAAGGKKVGILVTGSQDSVLSTTNLYRDAFRQIGLDSTDVVSFASASTSPLRAAQQLAAAGADSLLGFTSAEDMAAVIGAARQANLNLAASVSLSGYARSTLSSLGRGLAGVSIPVYFRPFEAGGAGLDRYRDAMVRYSPETTQPEQEFAMYGYLFADMFLRGLEVAGDCPTRNSFMTGLRQQRSYDADGLLAPINLGTNAKNPLSCYAFVKVNPAGTAFDVASERLCADGTTG